MNFARNYEKNNTWNIRRWVDEMIDPATHRIILKIVGFFGCLGNQCSKEKHLQFQTILLMRVVFFSWVKQIENNIEAYPH